MSSDAMEAQLDRFKTERTEMINKIDQLNSRINSKDKQISTLESHKESLSNQMSAKEKIISEIRTEISSEKGDNDSKLEALRAKNQTILDDLTQRKIEFEREKALKDQQLQF